MDGKGRIGWEDLPMVRGTNSQMGTRTVLMEISKKQISSISTGFTDMKDLRWTGVLGQGVLYCNPRQN